MDNLPLTGVRVLVVDDTPDSLDVTALVLELNGATVHTAPSASAALELLEAVTFDVLVTDLGMPHEDGYGLLCTVRRDRPDHNGFVPAIALSGYASAEDRSRSSAVGFRAHLAKPIEPAELVRVVAEVAAERT